MNTPLPLSLHISAQHPHQDRVVLNGKKLANLHQFVLQCDMDGVRTTYVAIGCFPDYVDAENDLNSNSAYPLRLRFSNDANDTMITYKGRPIPFIQTLYVALSAAERIIRMTVTKPIPELVEELKLLGVETSVGESHDAHL